MPFKIKWLYISICDNSHEHYYEFLFLTLNIGIQIVRYTKKKADEMLIQNLSSYATTETRPKYQEVIAECFGEWYNSKKPRDFCEKYLRKVGVIK